MHSKMRIAHPYIHSGMHSPCTTLPGQLGDLVLPNLVERKGLSQLAPASFLLPFFLIAYSRTGYLMLSEDPNLISSARLTLGAHLKCSQLVSCSSLPRKCLSPYILAFTNYKQPLEPGFSIVSLSSHTEDLRLNGRLV